MPNDFTIDPHRPPLSRNRPPRSGGESVAWLIALALVVAMAVAGFLGWRFYATAVAEAQRAAKEAQQESDIALAMAVEDRMQAELKRDRDVRAARDAAALGRREAIVADAELLWASPTAGPPIALDYVPAGTQCLVFLRPALLAAHPEGEKALAALGPWGQSAVAELQSLAHGELAELDAALVAILVNDDGDLTVSVRAALVDPWDDAELARRWSDAESRRHGEQPYRVAQDRAAFLPPDAEGETGRTLVACPAELAVELIDSEGAPPMLKRDLESLVATTDADRVATLLVAPHFLDAGGGGLLAGPAEPLRQALGQLVADGAAAVALSAHWDRNFFVELRSAPALNVSPRGLAAAVQKRLNAAPGEMDDLILAQAWPAYGRKVIARVPGMLRQLALTARRGESDKHALLRAYLPAIAGHNLLMGAELVLTQRGGAVAAPLAPAVASTPQTIDQRLAVVTSLSFSKDTLHRALEQLADDLGVPIEIEGNDLRAEGITQNQTFAVDLRDRPGAEILVEILRLANPDRSAESPADGRQKLVYVVEPGDKGGGRIIVTTRAAAEQRGLALPAVFIGTDE